MKKGIKIAIYTTKSNFKIKSEKWYVADGYMTSFWQYARKNEENFMKVKLD